MDAAEASLCAAIRGTPGIWRELVEPAAQSRFLAAATLHRLRPMLGFRLRASGELPSWPTHLREALADAERAEAALEIVRRRELCRLLHAFAAAGVDVLLLKGAAVAYTIYPEPWLRPREDTDLLVRSADARRAGEVLASAGYQPAHMQSGDFVTYQRLHVRTDRAGRRHACDLHWKIANPAPFADLLSPEDLLRHAMSVSLGDAPAARIPHRSHALLLACWHRVSHHHDSGDLLWLYDLHLLADRLPDADVTEVLVIARETRTVAICARGWHLARERFDTRLPAELLAEDETAADSAPSLEIYLKPGARKVDLLAADLRALPDWRSRARLVREHLFPPAEYMLSSHGGGWRRAMLPALYLWRIARGARRWFRPPDPPVPGSRPGR
jgi:hypothetical protein